MESPWVYMFGVNSVGRPIIAADAAISVDIPAGGSAMFETFGSFTQMPEQAVAFLSSL